VAIEIERMFVRLGLEMSDYHKGLKSAGKSLQEFGQGLSRTGKSLSLKVTAPLVAMGAVAGKTFAGFQKEMNNVRALTGATGGEFKALTDLAKNLGKTTQFSASQAAEAQGFLARAGLKTGQIMGALPKTLQLAAAANLDLAQAADLVTNVMSSARIPVEQLGRANDVLSKAAASSNTDVAQLGQAFKYAGTVASSAGLSFEETVAVLGSLGNVGIQASMAGTSLRGAITKLLNPTEEAAGILRQLGVQVTDSSGKMMPFSQILKQLEPIADDTGKILTIFGQRAGPAMAALLAQGSGSLDDFTNKLKNSTGVAALLASVQMEGLAGAWKRMTSAMEGAAIEIGARLEPFLIKIAEAVAKVATWVSNLQPKWIMLGIAVGAAVAAIGPLLVVLGSVISAIGTLLPMIGVVGAAFSGLAIPILAATAALLSVGLLVAIVVRNWNKLVKAAEVTFEELQRFFQGIYDSAKRWLVENLERVWQQVVNFFDPVVNAVSNFVADIVDFWADIVKEAKKWLVDKLRTGLNKMIQLINEALSLFGTSLDEIADKGFEVGGKVGDAFKRTGTAIADGVKFGVDEAGKELKTLGVIALKQAKNVGEGAADIGETFGKEVKAVLSDIGGAIKGAIFDFGDTGKMPELPALEAPKVADQASGFEAATKAAMTYTEALQQAGTKLREWQTQSAESMTVFQGIAVNTFQMMRDGIASAVADSIVYGKDLATAMQSLMKGIAKSIIETLVKVGIERAAQAIIAGSIMKKQAAATAASGAVQTYAGQFAAISSAPFPVNLTAPAVASSMVATLKAGLAGLATFLAEGGLVTGPTLAVVGEAGPEMVIPLNRANQFMGGGPTEVNIYMDGEKVAMATVPHIGGVLNARLGLEG